MRSTDEQYDRYRLAILDPEIAELSTKAFEGGDLSKADELSFFQFAIMVSYSAQNNWDAGQRGVMVAEEWQRVAPSIAGMYRTAGGIKVLGTEWAGASAGFCFGGRTCCSIER